MSGRSLASRPSVRQARVSYHVERMGALVALGRGAGQRAHAARAGMNDDGIVLGPVEPAFGKGLGAAGGHPDLGAGDRDAMSWASRWPPAPGVPQVTFGSAY